MVLMTGSWVFGMCDAYKTAARIIRGKESLSGKSELFWFPGVLVIFALFGVFLAFAFGMTDSISRFISCNNGYWQFIYPFNTCRGARCWKETIPRRLPDPRSWVYKIQVNSDKNYYDQYPFFTQCDRYNQTVWSCR